MTTEQKLLIHLIQSAMVGDENIAPLDTETIVSTDWNSVFEEASQQAVALMAFDAIGRYKDSIPSAVFDRWLRYSAGILRTNANVLSAQNELVGLLKGRAFPYIIMKGLSAAFYYPRPELRSLGDVDFLVHPDDCEKIGKVLEAAGYENWGYDHICHIVYRKQNAHLEMHFETVGIPDGEPGALFRAYLNNAPDRYIENENPVFHRPAPAVHAVILLLHTLHHMLGEGIGLRHLCDWGCLIHQTCDDAFWKDEVLPLLERTGTLKFAAVITKTSAIYFGTACPNWADGIPDELCEAVISDIFSLGNFGKKNKTRSASGRMISQHGKTGTADGKIKNLLKTLNSTMYTAYPILKKVKILYPFIFVWRILRYLFLMLMGKKASILKASTYADERKQIYDRFELYQVSNTK